MTGIEILLIVVLFLLVIWSLIYTRLKCDRIKAVNTKMVENINSLQHNQNVLVSTLKQLHTLINENERKNEKAKKEAKRAVRVVPGTSGTTKRKDSF